MSPLTYASLALLVLTISWLVFRVVVRRDYQRRGQLRPFSTLMEYVAIGSWVGLTYANVPRDWPAVHVGPLLEVLGSVLFYGGLALTVLSLVALGIRRSHGHEVARLKQSGFYRWSRNPQAVAFVVAIVGNLVLWPTWKNLVSLALLVVLLHLMIRTEEEHLRRLFGADYEQYCQRVPRFVALRRGAG